MAKCLKTIGAEVHRCLDQVAAANNEVDDSRFEKLRFRIVGVLKNEGGVNLSPFGNANVFVPLPQAIRLRAANLTPMERMGDTLEGESLMVFTLYLY